MITGMRSQTKMAVGGVLATIGGLLMAQSEIMGWYPFPPPWSSLVSFITGVLAGLGLTLAVVGLVERRLGR